MKQVALFLLLAVLLLLSSCRNPSLEQAIIDYNGNRYDKAFESISKAKDAVPEDPEMWYYYGEISGKQGNVEEMINAFDKSLSLSDKFASKIDNSKKYYFGKFYNDGVQSFNNSIKLEDKTSEDAKKLYGRIIKNFESALLIDEDFQARRLIAISYSNIGDTDNQLKYLKSATEAAPDTVVSWLELGYFYYNQKDFDNALSTMEKAAEVDPSNPEALTMVAQLYDNLGETAKAINAYKKAIEVNPDDKAIPFNLGLLLYKKVNNDSLQVDKYKNYLREATVYFSKAIDIDPELIDVYGILSAAYINLNEYDNAEAILKKGLDMFPDSYVIWQNLAVLYARQGKKDQAKDAEKRAQALQ